MRKKILIPMLLAVGYMMPIQASEVPEVLKSSYFSIFPGMYSGDGKSFLYTYGRTDDVIDKFYVYDESMQLVKEIEPIQVPAVESKSYRQERKYAYETVTPVYEDQWSENPLEINGQTEGLSIERVQNYLLAMYNQGDISSLSDGTPIVVRWYFDVGIYGKMYPECYYRQENGKWYEFAQRYETSGLYGPFGEWGEVQESTNIEGVEVEGIDIIPENGGDENYYRLTKGIFGDDYHYIMPVYVNEDYSEEQEYDEKPGWIYYKSWGKRYKCKGYQVFDSTNKVVASFEIPADYPFRYSYLYFFTMGKNRYFTIECEGAYEDSDDYLLIYRLGSNNSVSFVGAAPTSKVSPRNPRRGEIVNVTLDSAAIGADGAMMQVVSASGQTMLNTKLSADQTSLDINTSGFQQGMYVVTICSNGVTKEAAKIIVR